MGFNFNLFERRCLYMFSEFGTSLQCNRFDVGNCIEYNFAETLQENGFKVEKKPNAKRIDIDIVDYDKVSLKYTSSGDIKLVNSLGENKEMSLEKTVIITPTSLWLISEDLLKHFGIDAKEYLFNTKDGISLRRKLLSKLAQTDYPFRRDINIEFDRKMCRNRQCSEIIWEHVKRSCD